MNGGVKFGVKSFFLLRCQYEWRQGIYVNVALSLSPCSTIAVQVFVTRVVLLHWSVLFSLFYAILLIARFPLLIAHCSFLISHWSLIIDDFSLLLCCVAPLRTHWSFLIAHCSFLIDLFFGRWTVWISIKCDRIPEAKPQKCVFLEKRVGNKSGGM